MWPSKYGGDSDDPLVVLVVGDHGSGKSSLIHWLEHGCPPKQRPRPTVGMALAVLESFGPSGEFLVELHEVGGHDAFASARVIIVSDASESNPQPAAWSELGFGGKAKDAESPVQRWVRELEEAGERSKSNVLGVHSANANPLFAGSGRDPENGGQDDLSDLEGGDGSSAAHLAPSGVDSNGDGVGMANGANNERSFGWVQRPCPGRGLGCGGAPVRTPMLVVGNKADLGVAALSYNDEQRRLSHRSQSHANTNPHVLLSATDPHLDTKGLHDFFHAAREFKLGHASNDSSTVISDARQSMSKWLEAAVPQPMRTRADTDSGLVRAGSSLLGAESLDPSIGVHRVGSWGSSSSTGSTSSNSSCSSSGGSSTRSDLLLRGVSQPLGTPERRHSGPHGGSSWGSSSSTSSNNRGPGTGKGVSVPVPAPLIANAHAPSPGRGIRNAPAPAALPRVKEKEGKLS